jgi:hypothetical protein
MLWSMKSIFHTLGSKFKKKPKDAQAAADEAAAVRASRRAKQAQAAGKPAPDPVALAAGKRAGGGSAAPAAKPAAAPGTIAAMEVEQDELLEMISSNVERIGHMGRQMGDELTRQDAMLDELVAGVGKADVKLAANAKEARRQAQ